MNRSARKDSIEDNEIISSRENENDNEGNSRRGEKEKSGNSPTLTHSPPNSTNYLHNPTNNLLFLLHSYHISASTYILSIRHNGIECPFPDKHMYLSFLLSA